MKMLIPWPHYVSRKRPWPCSLYHIFRGLLWFADVTLHSIWRESFPGAVRQRPSFALLSSLLGAASGRGCAGKPQRVDANMASKWGRNTYRLILVFAYLNAKNVTIFILLITVMTHKESLCRLIITLMHSSVFYKSLSLCPSFVLFCLLVFTSVNSCPKGF